MNPAITYTQEQRDAAIKAIMQDKPAKAAATISGMPPASLTRLLSNRGLRRMYVTPEERSALLAQRKARGAA